MWTADGEPWTTQSLITQIKPDFHAFTFINQELRSH